MATLDERALVTRLEAANVGELLKLMVRPSAAEEQVLRIHLGDEVYQRLHGLALESAAIRQRSTKRQGNVVVIPSLLGSELSTTGPGGVLSRIWLDPLYLGAGGLTRLWLAPNGLAERDTAREVRPTGILKRVYGELLLTLARHWEVRAFWYDWRKDLKIAAAQLEAAIDGWFSEGEQVHLVAHGMGAHVARTFLALYPRRWSRGGKLLMLGSPSHGTFVGLQALTGTASLLRRLAVLDARHSLAELTRIAVSFVGLYQLLPSPLLDPGLEALYQARSYHGSLEIEQHHLDAARSHHELLRDVVVDPKRAISVEGYGRPTPSGVDIARLAELDPFDEPDNERECFKWTTDGDGVVPHALGGLGPDGCGAPRFYVNAGHEDLPSSPELLAVLDALLDGAPTALPTEPPKGRDEGASAAEPAAFERRDKEERQADKDIQYLSRQLRGRLLKAKAPDLISTYERDIATTLSFPLVGARGDASTSRCLDVPFAPPSIEIRVIYGDLASVDSLDSPDLPIDAIAFGQYQGQPPSHVLDTLDREISQAIARQTNKTARATDEAPSSSPEGSTKPPAHDSALILTQFIQRGILRGELGQLFFLDDPRQSASAPLRRLITVAGMGLPGRFDEPQATVLARELCWSLGQLGKRHLLTRLIGAGRFNLSIRAAISAWMRGIKLALTGKTGQVLERITFIEYDPARVIEIHDALHAEKADYKQRNRLVLKLVEMSETERQTYQEKRVEFVAKALDRAPQQKPFPSRITVSLEGDKYRFGALTEQASVPEREIHLDRSLVERANDELAAAPNLSRQVERGQFLSQLLLPQELGPEVFERTPLVLLLDATTARIHWELMAAPGAHETTGNERYHVFLGSLGLTRQLRTTFAPLPDPPAPPCRVLRVVIVADPAEDAHLPGAEEEGAAIAELFERFNVVHKNSQNRVEVVRMFGPRAASRTAVLRQLMLRSCDVLHFAGHCTYNAKDPPASGWLFSNGEIISARELRRIDRIPRFVFSNACQSGITPDRSELRTAALAPSFAEAFFERGVSNFVCTAWPVDDVAARDFALTLYAALLGLDVHDGPRAGGFAEMHDAMSAARRAIVESPRGALTWGAYQHYGNPHFKLFKAGLKTEDT